MASKITEASGFLPLHPLEFRILMSLTAGPSYGTRIVQEIEEIEAGRMTLYPANLYRRIRDLVGRDLLAECAAPEGADPRRTYVCLTRLGGAVASEEARRLQDLLHDALAHDLLAGG